MTLRRLARLGARIAVVIGSSIGLLAAAHTSLHTTSSLVSPSQMAGARSTYEGVACLRHELSQLVPKGATVYVGDGSTLTSQLLLEAATLWANPLPSPRVAAWEASLQPGKGCLGYALKAHKLS
jgi:hypothetical protein